MKNLICTLWKDERGQSTTEYILILSAVVMIAMKFKQTFGQTMLKLLANLNTQVEEGMQQNN